MLNCIIDSDHNRNNISVFNNNRTKVNLNIDNNSGPPTSRHPLTLPRPSPPGAAHAC